LIVRLVLRLPERSRGAAAPCLDGRCGAILRRAAQRPASTGAAPPCLDGRCGAMLRRALRCHASMGAAAPCSDGRCTTPPRRALHHPAPTGAAAQRPYCRCGTPPYRRHAPQRPTVGDLPPDAERPHASVVCRASQFLFDAQQLVVLRHAIGARRRAGLDLPGIRRHHQVGNRDIFTLA